MARAHYVNKAQKNIYVQGKRVEYVSEKGKRQGQTLSKIDKTVPSGKDDQILIAKGEPYWWWQFMNGGKYYSKTQPRPSQLTQSGFLSTLYEIQERIVDFECDNKDDFDSFRDEVVSDLQSLLDDTQSSLDSMPEHLQESSVSYERIPALEEYISELENIECDYDEDELRDVVKEENEYADEDTIEELLKEKIQEKVNDAIEELQNCSCYC